MSAGIRRWTLLPLYLWAGCFSAAASAQTAAGYGEYTAWQNWAKLRPGTQAGLASSYDRAGANADFCHYESPSGIVTAEQHVTVATLTGPGVIRRFWMPHYTANRYFMVRMFFDGQTTPRIDATSDVILSGSFSYFTAPLVGTFAGGQVCHEPIPFETSVRIETVNYAIPEHPAWDPNRHYYQYSYTLLPPETPIDSYSGSLTPEQQTARGEVVNLFTNSGQHPAGDDPSAIVLTTPATTLPGGQTRTLADLTGPGLIRRLNVKMNGASDEELAGLCIKVYYDLQSTAVIDVPVAYFFGAGQQRAPYRSLPIGTDSPDGFYCYWPMPFHKAVTVALKNTTAAPITIDSAAVEYVSSPIDTDLCYLHAALITSVQSGGDIYHPILSVEGAGHYVGNLLYVQQPDDSFYMLEGDEVVTVDATVVMNGTGLEDAYNGGYYYNWVAVQHDEPDGGSPSSAIRPLHGILHVDRQAGLARADQYRWQIADCVPFARRIDVKIENRYSVAGAEWTSVAFYYKWPSVPADLNRDLTVNWADFTVFASHWLDSNCTSPDYCSQADINADGAVDWQDFTLFADDWLWRL